MRAVHKKILVVDDDPVVGRSFDRVLTKQGYVVITARDGQEALAKLATEEYDVVFTDIKMPGMNGLDVAERVRARRPWTPVVIITGYGTFEQEKRAEAAGVTEFLHKPLSPEMIEGSARKALDAAAAAPAGAAPELAAAAEPTVAREGLVKSIALFFAAPFIGLAYMIAFPVVASVMLAGVATEAAAEYGLTLKLGRAMRHTGMIVAAPFVGLAFILAFPVIGLGLLGWFAAQAVLRERAN